jgi:soluble lytic murein transglycosylase-like protein
MDEHNETMPPNTGPWRGYVSPPARAVSGPDLPGYLLWQWDREKLSPWRFRMSAWWRAHQTHVHFVAVVTFAFLLGVIMTGNPRLQLRNMKLAEELSQTRSDLTARQGELELARLELNRSNTILAFSGKHSIDGGLAVSIYDIAIAEGIDPKIAFALVGVESDFTSHAVSSVGAIGLAQLMPSTASWLEPGIARNALFDRDTNLRLGFRYLHLLLEQYKGDLRLALLAYNRGPGRVDEILRAGGNPGNGYSTLVQRRALPGMP